MKYLVDNGKCFSCEHSAAEYIMERCDEAYYDDMLDDVYGTISVCDMGYSASAVLYGVDEIAYHCGRSEWEDSETREIVYHLERMDIEDVETFFGYTVEAIADDDERAA